MAKLKSQTETLYGLPQPLSSKIQDPIPAKRDPTTSDTGYSPGQLWINKLTGSYFGLAANAGGVATWSTLGNVTSTYTALTSASYATTTANAITLASGNVFTGTGANAAIGFTFTPKGAGNTVFTTGNVTLSSGNLVLTSGNATLTSGNLTLTNGNISLGTAGKGLSIKAGANARIGTGTLVGGTLAIANTSCTANTRVFIQCTDAKTGTGGVPGHLEAVVAAGVGFTVNSYDNAGAPQAADVSDFCWLLVESA
jgi:heat shock protein HslJ